ncbi:MAG: type II toxin-antitoxin system HicA family toxin [Thermodesulfobacteriota bacterium]
MDSGEVIMRLEGAGWRLAAQKGSHRQYKHPDRPGRVTVPHPVRDLPQGTLASIRRQSGLALGREDGRK